MINQLETRQICSFVPAYYIQLHMFLYACNVHTHTHTHTHARARCSLSPFFAVILLVMLVHTCIAYTNAKHSGNVIWFLCHYFSVHLSACVCVCVCVCVCLSPPPPQHLIFCMVGVYFMFAVSFAGFCHFLWNGHQQHCHV